MTVCGRGAPGLTLNGTNVRRFRVTKEASHKTVRRYRKTVEGALLQARAFDKDEGLFLSFDKESTGLNIV